jgi:hypothetical protein
VSIYRLTRCEAVRILCARGDLNPSRARCIGVHFRSSEAASGVNLGLSDPSGSIHGHLDTWAAVSDLVSKPPFTAARSPPANPML